MDEMNNVTMENETSMMENAPVENLVPAEAEGYTSDCGCESNANLDLGKIVKIGVGAALLIGAGVKYGIPAAKKGFKHIKEKRHVVGGVLMSVSLFFGGLAFTLMTVKGEPDEERNA